MYLSGRISAFLPVTDISANNDMIIYFLRWVTAALSNELLEERPHAICLIDAQLSCTCSRHREMECLLVSDLLFVVGEKKNDTENPRVSAAVPLPIRLERFGMNLQFTAAGLD